MICRCSTSLLFYTLHPSPPVPNSIFRVLCLLMCISLGQKSRPWMQHTDHHFTIFTLFSLNIIDFQLCSEILRIFDFCSNAWESVRSNTIFGLKTDCSGLNRDGQNGNSSRYSIIDSESQTTLEIEPPHVIFSNIQPIKLLPANSVSLQVAMSLVLSWFGLLVGSPSSFAVSGR